MEALYGWNVVYLAELYIDHGASRAFYCLPMQQPASEDAPGPHSWTRVSTQSINDQRDLGSFDLGSYIAVQEQRTLSDWKTLESSPCSHMDVVRLVKAVRKTCTTTTKEPQACASDLISLNFLSIVTYF